MKSLLMFFGSPEYHATCLSPVLWAIIAFALFSIIVGCVCDAKEKRVRRRRRYSRGRRRDGLR